MSEVAPERIPPLTVADALRVPSLQRGRPRVLSGERHLGRAVRWVHVGEVPNIAELLRGGELLLTTGQALDAPPAAQRELIRRLARRGVAGVVLELGQRLSEPPEAAVAAARQEGLPFVVLRREVRFVDVTEELHRRLIDRQLSVLRRAELLDRTLTGLVAGGEGIPAVVEALARSVGAAVALHGRHHEVLYETKPAAPAPAHGGSFSIDVPGAAGAAGRLVVRLPHGEPGAYEALAAERTASVIALLMARVDHDRLLALRERGAFLGELATGTLAPQEAERRAVRLGLGAGNERLLPFVVLLEPDSLGEHAERTDTLAQLARDLAVETEAEGQFALIGTRAQADPLVGLVTMPRGFTREAAAERLAAKVHRSVARRFGEDAVAIVVVGEEAASIGAAGEPLRTALETAPSAADATRRAWHDAATPDLERLLVALRADERLARWVEQRLRAVVEHDARSSAPLLPTLVALTDTLGRRSATAQRLGIRRQSLYRRIERLERLLGASLDDADTLLELRLALRARRIIA
jgi:purine catabolism regulator